MLPFFIVLIYLYLSQESVIKILSMQPIWYLWCELLIRKKLIAISWQLSKCFRAKIQIHKFENI